MPQIETYDKTTTSNKGSRKDITGSDTEANDQRALHTMSFGITADNKVLPIKVVDDGDGYGKVSATLE